MLANNDAYMIACAVDNNEYLGGGEFDPNEPGLYTKEFNTIDAAKKYIKEHEGKDVDEGENKLVECTIFYGIEIK